MVSNTPLRMYKINTHQGGHQVPFIVHWPAGLDVSGDPFRRYRPLDFELSQPPIVVATAGAVVQTLEHNVLVAELRSAGFEIRVLGFDEHRDLRLRVVGE